MLLRELRNRAHIATEAARFDESRADLSAVQTESSGDDARGLARLRRVIRVARKVRRGEREHALVASATHVGHGVTYGHRW